MSEDGQPLPMSSAQLDEPDSPPHHARNSTKTVTLYANGNQHFFGKQVSQMRDKSSKFSSPVFKKIH